MKKIIVLFLGVMLLSGCTSKEEKYKKILKEHAKTYYETYMIGAENQDQAEITIEMMKKANEYGGSFELKKLSKCDDATTVTLTLSENKDVVSYDFDLKCD